MQAISILNEGFRAAKLCCLKADKILGEHETHETSIGTHDTSNGSLEIYARICEYVLYVLYMFFMMFDVLYVLISCILPAESINNNNNNNNNNNGQNSIFLFCLLQYLLRKDAAGLNSMFSDDDKNTR